LMTAQAPSNTSGTSLPVTQYDLPPFHFGGDMFYKPRNNRPLRRTERTHQSV
jgi:hypothetical protein